MKHPNHNNQITIYESEDGKARIEVRKELDEKSVVEEFSATASDGKSYKTRHYSLKSWGLNGY